MFDITPDEAELRFDYRGFGHRLRVTRIALGLTEDQAAAVGGRSVETWRKYEATGQGRCTVTLLRFCERYDVSLDWLFCGETAGIRGHLAKHAQGTIVVLPVKGPRYRRAHPSAPSAPAGGAA